MRLSIPTILLAVLILSTSLSGQEPDLAARKARARALESEGKTAEAAAEWKAICLAVPEGQGPANREAADRLFALLKPEGRYLELENIYKTALESRPEDSAVLSYLALTLQLRKRYDQAEKAYRKLAELDSTQAPWAWRNLGLLIRSQPGREREAAQACLTAMEGYTALGRAYDRAPEDPVMAKAAKDSRASAVSAADAADNIALGYVQRRRFGPPSEIWLRIGKLQGLAADRRARAWLYLGIQEFQYGSLDTAVSHLERAVALQPQDAVYLNNLGIVLLAKRNQERALSIFEKCLEIDPKNTDALENLGIFNWKRNRVDGARRFFLKGHAIAVEKLAQAKRASEKSADSDEFTRARLDAALQKARYRLFRFENYLQRLEGDVPRSR